MFNKRPEVGKWTWGISVTKDYMVSDRGWNIFHAYCIKLTSAPQVGARMISSDYKGFNFKFAFWFPIDTTY
jgi:hypothetical protein